MTCGVRARAGLVGIFMLLVASSANAFTIRGTLENGTTGAKNVTAKIVVVNPSQGMEEQGDVDVRDGRFEIRDLDANAPVYLLRVDYAGVTYSTPVQVTGADQEVAVVVYEATASWDGVHVVVPHLAASRFGDHLQIEQLFEISNQSSPPRTLNGDEGFFHLYLPADMETLLTCFAAALGVPIDQTPMPTDTPGRYRIDYPLRPGVTRIGVAFTLPYATGRYTLTEKVFQDIDHVTVFGVDPNIKVSSPSQTLEAMDAVHGMSAYAVHQLTKGSELVLSFEGGDPNFAGTGGGEGDGSDQNVLTVNSDSESLSLFVIAALAFTFAGMVAVVLRDRGDPLSDPKVLRRHYDSMVARLARLDDLHAAEAIPGEAYRAAREELMTRTAALAIRLRAQDTTTHQPASLPGQAAPAAAPQTKAR